MDFSFNTASMIGTGISAGISAVGSIFTTRYNNAIAKAQANIAKENAKTMELQAQYTLFAAETKVQHETMQAGQVKARQKAALAANGVAIGSGSAAQITASTDIIKTINKNRIETDAHAAAWGYRQRATDFKNQALMFNAKKQSVGLNFMSTALNGLSQVGMTYAFGKLAEGKTKEPAKDTPLKVDAISGADPGRRSMRFHPPTPACALTESPRPIRESELMRYLRPSRFSRRFTTSILSRSITKFRS